METESCPNTVDGSEFYHLIWLKSKFDCPHASYIWNIFHYSFTIERNQPFMWVNIPYQSHGSYGLGVTNLWRNAIQQKLESWPKWCFFWFSFQLCCQWHKVGNLYKKASRKKIWSHFITNHEKCTFSLSCQAICSCKHKGSISCSAQGLNEPCAIRFCQTVDSSNQQSHNCYTTVAGKKQLLSKSLTPTPEKKKQKKTYGSLQIPYAKWYYICNSSLPFLVMDTFLMQT